MSASLQLYTQGKTTTAYTTSTLPKSASIGGSIKFTSIIYEPTSSSYTSNPKSGILRNTFNYITNRNINFNIVGVSKKGAANVIEFDADTDSNPILSRPIDDGFGVILQADFIPSVRDTDTDAPPIINPYTPPVPVVTPLPTTAVSYIKPGQIINAPSINDVSSDSTIIKNIPITNITTSSNFLLYIMIIVLFIIVGLLYYKLRHGVMNQRTIMGGNSIDSNDSNNYKKSPSSMIYGGAQFIATTILGGIGYAIGGTVGSMGISRMTGINRSGGNNKIESNNHEDKVDQNLPEMMMGGKSIKKK